MCAHLSLQGVSASLAVAGLLMGSIVDAGATRHHYREKEHEEGKEQARRGCAHRDATLPAKCGASQRNTSQ